jgi:broad specificity phosphatase PhoE
MVQEFFSLYCSCHLASISLSRRKILNPNSRYFTVTNDWYAGKHDSCFPNGENYNTLRERFYHGLEYVTRNHENRDLIIVGHGGIFTVGILDLCSIADRIEFLHRPNQNCSISEIILEEKKRRRATLVRWADHSHLHGEASQFISGLPKREEIHHYSDANLPTASPD